LAEELGDKVKGIDTGLKVYRGLLASGKREPKRTSIPGETECPKGLFGSCVEPLPATRDVSSQNQRAAGRFVFL